MSDNAVEEVREFLDRLPQRSPQEAIGMRDEGGLFRGMIVSTVALAVVTLLGTVGPYAWSSVAEQPIASENTASPESNPADSPAAPSDTESTPDTPAAAAGSAATTGDGNEVANPDRVLNSLGIGESKESAPDVNPLESDLDNLLDGVK